MYCTGHKGIVGANNHLTLPMLNFSEHSWTSPAYTS
jgi:hypothetical protein